VIVVDMEFAATILRRITAESTDTILECEQFVIARSVASDDGTVNGRSRHGQNRRPYTRSHIGSNCSPHL
jgi:hypothetical protein